MPINGEAARSARLPNRPVAESNDQYCVGGVLDVGLAVDERLRQGTLRDHHQEPDHHRSGHEDADLVRAEEPAQHERLNNGGGLSDHQADRGHRRSALEHTAQARPRCRSRLAFQRCACARPLRPAGGLPAELT